MSPRTRPGRPWWGLVLLWGCLNPQPDTNPLSPEVTGSAAGENPPASPGRPQSVGEGSMTDDGINLLPEPPEPPPLAAQDAGAPPAQDAGTSAGPISVTFSSTDAGALVPDAGAPPAEE